MIDDANEGHWVKAEAPARIDLSGGWSDTPPITNEHGGKVTNVAVKVDGKRPIGAKIRKIPKLELVFVLCSGTEKQTIKCETLDDLKDHSNPGAPGALLKTAFLCTKTVSLSSTELPLEKQLERNHGCGFEIYTWSYLPHGSGMGTSSILAGVVCAAIWKITSRDYNNQELLHLVVEVEQMLTTGGGWQDQVGGLLPGVKLTTSPARLPIQVQPELLEVSGGTLEKVKTNMALIYTGKTRLAKNLLQKVLDRWRSRTPEIVQNVDDLTSNAEICADAWRKGDLEKMGQVLNTYREQKKIMAPDSEPREICEIINSVKPHVHGCCLAGAGGGGYLFVITKQPNQHEELKRILQNLSTQNNLYTVHRIEVDTEGLTVTE